MKKALSMLLAVLMTCFMVFPVLAEEAETKKTTAPKFDFTYGQTVKHLDLSKYTKVSDFLPILFKYMEKGEYENVIRVLADEKCRKTMENERRKDMVDILYGKKNFFYQGSSGKQMGLHIFPDADSFTCMVAYGDKIEYLNKNNNGTADGNIPYLSGNGAIVTVL